MMSAFDPYTNGGTAVSFYIENGLSNCMLDRNEWWEDDIFRHLHRMQQPNLHRTPPLTSRRQTRPHVDDDNLFTAGSLVQIMVIFVL